MTFDLNENIQSEICEDCRSFNIESDKDVGECRFNPPVAYTTATIHPVTRQSQLTTLAIFPPRKKTDFSCSQFQNNLKLS